METASDVKNDSGILVAPKGTVLTERHLRAFKAWGIIEAKIRSGEEEEAPTMAWDDIDMKTRSKISNTVDRLYAANDRNDPIVAEFEKITISVLVKRLGNQRKPKDLAKAS